MNQLLVKTNKIPQTWSESKTVLIPKINKPSIKDLRPIALTNILYKVFMGILKTKIENHIKDTENESEIQAGFTKKRRICDNLFILNYCIDQSFKNKKALYLISIDFTKAFDSIKRDKLIYVLKKYKINHEIIDIIYQIYSSDITEIYFNNQSQCNMKITNGIRQGCNASSILFLLITYTIIEILYEKLNGINFDICKIVALFFADDGILLAQSLQETEECIDLVTDVAKDFGLNINKKKSNILIFNKKDQPNNIREITVTNKINYLGVTIQNKKDCFKIQKLQSLDKARKYSNLMPVIISRSCNKILIGKTFWKSAALPIILHGAEILYYTKKQLNDLQTEENKAFRYTINAQNVLQSVH